MAPVQLLREFTVLQDDSDDIPAAELAEAFEAFWARFQKIDKVPSQNKTQSVVNPNRTRQASYDLLKAFVNAIQACGFALWEFMNLTNI